VFCALILVLPDLPQQRHPAAICGAAGAFTELRPFVKDRAPGHRQPATEFAVDFAGVEMVRLEQRAKDPEPMFSQEGGLVETRGRPEPMAVRLARLRLTVTKFLSRGRRTSS
jgi:hypothetical protein